MKIERKIVGFAVATPGDAPKAPEVSAVPASSFVNDSDRRMVLSETNADTPELALERRPQDSAGHEGITYCIKAPHEKVYVTVNHVGNKPFEVFIRANNTRGLESLAQSLSADLRTGDRKFIRRKLDAIGKVKDAPFDFVMPDGLTYRMTGVVSCIARLILYRCEQLWEGSESTTTYLYDALLVKREPKTTPDGTLSWTVDVDNQATQDDFKLFVTEATDGDKTRPFSIWIDLQVGPMGWVGKKLQQLLDYAEPRAEFRARVPGQDKHEFYASTEAYIADLILYRLHKLGLLARDGSPLHAAPPVLTLVPAATPAPQGLLCSQCNAYAVVVASGCGVCQSCGYSKCS